MDKQDKKLYQMQEDLKKSERVNYRKDILAIQHYAGTDPRRRQELMDFNIINQDSNAIANMPTSPQIRPYKKEAGYLGYRTTDEEGGI